MPKEITHCLLAERAAHAMAASGNPYKKKIGGEIYFLFEKNPEPLYFGSVSPDIFYYDIRMPWEFRIKHRGLIWGELIHGTHGENSLAHVLEMLAILQDAALQKPLLTAGTLSRDDRAALLLFALGYLSHVALDTILHPIVYFYSGNYYAEDRAEKLRAEARHRAVETIFDLYNLDSVGSDLRQYRGLKKMTLPRRQRDLVLGFYTLALLRAWPNLARDEFGAKGEIPADIYKHPLFKIAVRSYKKQLMFNRIFQNPRLAHWGLGYNRRRADALHFNSSLLYPARSYADYQNGNRGQLFAVADLREYRHPLDNSLHPIHRRRITAKIFARTHAFFRSAFLFAEGQISRAEAARVLKGYSLNNGKVGVRTDAMRYFAPLPINGNFEYLDAEGAP
ncbi:MAG: zinc dependent phospholipase C family protein [Turneriella sp.]|nr:zinc dependent phospholipase C family protein [Turneriella sp.]